MTKKSESWAHGVACPGPEVTSVLAGGLSSTAWMVSHSRSARLGASKGKETITVDQLHKLKLLLGPPLVIIRRTRGLPRLPLDWGSEKFRGLPDGSALRRGLESELTLDRRELAIHLWSG